jgi:hypothetical protein
MTWNLPVAEMKQVLGSIPAYTLTIAMSPIFLVLAFFYLCLHPARAESTAETNPACEQAAVN